MVLIVGTGVGLAASPQLWSTTAVEGRPDLRGRTALRAEQQLSMAAGLGEGWTMVAQGSVRDPSAEDAPLKGDLLRLHVQHDAGIWHIDSGRFARLDLRGAQHLDGAAVEVDLGDWRVSSWAGRRWAPEVWRVDTTLVGGAGAEARVAPGTDAGVGVESRWATGGTQLRSFVALCRRGSRGAQAIASVEHAALHAAGERAELAGDLPLQYTSIGASVRWENLPEDLLPVGVSTPMQWLAPEGYGVVSLRSTTPLGPLSLDIRGGPAVFREGPMGGQGRAWLSATGRTGLHSAVVAVGGITGDAGLLGGVVEGGVQRGTGSIVADVGVFSLRPSIGPAAQVWEARVRGTLPTALSAAHLKLELATGVDRVLAPFVRGGLALVLGPGGMR